MVVKAGNNMDGAAEQYNHYYPFGGVFETNSNNNNNNNSSGSNQPYKYNGKEFDRMYGLDWYDYSARIMDPTLGRFTTIDPLAEKYPNMSPYVYCDNNPIKYVDLQGDSLTLVGQNAQAAIMAIYNGLADNTNITMKFNNGVLDPTSIAEQAQNTSDFFLQDLYEIASNSAMVELSVSDNSTYIMDGQKATENFSPVSDDDTSKDPPYQQEMLKMQGFPIGKHIRGNLGQTLIPGNASASGKSSTNGNIQIIINGKSNINQRSVGIAHEFGHAILYMRGQPYWHPLKEVDKFVYGRATKMARRFGYDF
jgi:RHS repeat-associated protein